jgi:methionyl aminopeptidase
VPGSRVVEAGDLVKIDVALDVAGFLADSCTTVAVPPVSARSICLMRATQSALALGIHRARHGMAINRIGRAVADEAHRRAAGTPVGAHGLTRLG